MFTAGFRGVSMARRGGISRSNLVQVAALSAVTLALFITTAPASAQTWQSSVSGYYILASGPYQDSNQVPLTNTDTSTPNQSENYAVGGAYQYQEIGVIGQSIGGEAGAEGYAAAEAGAVHAYAHVVAKVPAAQAELNGPGAYSNLNAYASVTASAGITDTITFNSATLPFGTDLGLVAVGMTIDVWTNYPISSYQWLADPVGVRGYLQFANYGLTLSSAGYSFPRFYTVASTATSVQKAASTGAYYHAHVGDTLPFSMAMTAFGNVQVTDVEKNNNDRTILDYYVDARHTGHFWVNELPDGVTVTSASGYNYVLGASNGTGSAAAPEPATLAFLLPALAYLAGRLRRRKN